MNTWKRTAGGPDAPPSPSQSAALARPRKPIAAYLLVIASLFMACGLFTTYTLALSLDHVTGMTFISYTGDFPPESCIFSLVFTIVSTLYCIIIYIRFTQISHMIVRQNFPPQTVRKLSVCNCASLLFGEVGVFGLGMVGCFQRRVFHMLHLIGVFIGSYFTYVYFNFQIFFSFKISSLATPLFIKIIRILLVLTSGIILLIAPTFPLYFWVISGSDFHPVMVDYEVEADVNSTAAAIEWFFFFMYQAFLYSFYCDLKKITLLKDQIIFLEN